VLPVRRVCVLGGDESVASEPVTIVTKPLADRLFPNGGVGEAIGKRLTFGVAGAKDSPSHTLTIVGVTGDFPTAQMNSDRAQLLLSLAQQTNFRPKSI